MKFDAVIVGGGFAGLTAANHIALAGLKPIVLEAGTDDSYICNSRVSTGALHVAFRSPDDPASELFETIMSATDRTAREDIARALADNAKDTIDWMREEGCDFMQHPRRSWGMPMMMPGREMRAGLDWENSGPNLFLGALAEKLIQRGGELRRGVRVTALELEESTVTGVFTEGGDVINASAVVIADGGFQADRDLIGRYITEAPEKIRQRNTQTGRGDGLRMAMNAGADTVGLDKFYGHVLSRDAMTKEKLWPYPQLDVVCAKGIVVTPDGHRFADEGQGGIYLTNQIASLKDPLSATAIFDCTVWEDARETDIVPPNPSLLENGGTVLEADSLGALAKMAGVQTAGLLETVDEYNQALRAGSITGLSPARSTQTYPAHIIGKAPFYAVPVCAGITVTSGGLAVGAKAEVLDKNGAPIEGLYAAGSVVGGLEGGPRAGYVGGLIKAFGIGRIAGRTIVESLN
ncbi:MAG: FAD-dependent oxidoreductase [Pseudomonadota bacterium]|nr:FAD-dependent oxidoreductase [Pseudomonadota bacterium]